MRNARGFSVVELLVSLVLMGSAMAVVWSVFSTSNASTSKGMALLDALSRRTRLSEQLKRVLRLAGQVKREDQADGTQWTITFVERIDGGGTAAVLRTATLKVAPRAPSGLTATFAREGQRPVQYALDEIAFALDAGNGLSRVRFRSPRDATSFTVASVYLSATGRQLLPPGLVAPPPAGPTGALPSAGGGAWRLAWIVPALLAGAPPPTPVPVQPTLTPAPAPSGPLTLAPPTPDPFGDPTAPSIADTGLEPLPATGLKGSTTFARPPRQPVTLEPAVLDRQARLTALRRIAPSVGIEEPAAVSPGGATDDPFALP